MALKKILLIEDEVSLLQPLCFKMKQEGYEVECVANGQEGLDVVFDMKPDLILLDIVMPRMDGMTFLKHLRNDEWGKTVPVIVLTNLTDSEKVSDAASQGVYDYLVKTDWSLEQVAQRVKERLK